MSILEYAVLTIGVLVALGALYLVVVALAPGFAVPEQPLATGKKRTREKETKGFGTRKDVRFDVDGTPLCARLYLPMRASGPVPCIVMGHGFGGVRAMGLGDYALRYQEAGFAVLVFDYRHLGESGGEPRQLIWIPRQLADWSAAIKYARGLEEIDPARIALWGTSLSGGHVILTAAKDRQVACVAAQCPGLDGRASARMAFERQGLSFRLIMHGQRDLVRSWLRLSPHKIPIVGRPGSIACLTGPDAYDGFAAMAPDNFINEVCARIVIRADKYRPIKYAKDVRCPVLLQICAHDSVTPKSTADEAIQMLGKYAEVKTYPVGHFDIYSGASFEKSVSDQVAFFSKHLLNRHS
jgi:uncharacterized protein